MVLIKWNKPQVILRKCFGEKIANMKQSLNQNDTGMPGIVDISTIRVPYKL